MVLMVCSYVAIMDHRGITIIEPVQVATDFFKTDLQRRPLTQNMERVRRRKAFPSAGHLQPSPAVG